MKRILITIPAILIVFLTLSGTGRAQDVEFPIFKAGIIFKSHIALYQNAEISLKEIILNEKYKHPSGGHRPLSDKELEGISAGGLQFSNQKNPYPSSALIILWDEAKAASSNPDNSHINATVNW